MWLILCVCLVVMATPVQQLVQTPCRAAAAAAAAVAGRMPRAPVGLSSLLNPSNLAPGGDVPATMGVPLVGLTLQECQLCHSTRRTNSRYMSHASGETRFADSLTCLIHAMPSVSTTS